MKRLVSFISILLLAVVANAQVYNNQNSYSRQAMVFYQLDRNGYYEKVTNKNLNVIDTVVAIYAYDKKSQDLYAYNDYGNYVIKVTNDVHKMLKKDKGIAGYKPQEISALRDDVNSRLEAHFSEFNRFRKIHIEDSIAKAREDSIAEAKAIAAAEALRKAKVERDQLILDYRNSHTWEWVPVKDFTSKYEYSSKANLKCDLCDETLTKDYVHCIAIINDTMYTREASHLGFDQVAFKIHKIAIPESLKKNDVFNFHCEVFRDSLSRDSIYADGGAQYLNGMLFLNALGKIKERVPYGYIEDYTWDDEYGGVSLELTYTNTSEKTVKYIEVFFSIFNAVDDLRCKGSLNGTGPIEPLASGSWDWDYTRYYTAGDSKYLRITKLVITYMDGSKRTVSNNNGELEYDEDEVKALLDDLNVVPTKFTVSSSMASKILEYKKQNVSAIDYEYMDKEPVIIREEPPVVGERVIDVVEQMPSFPGGPSALMQYLASNIKYPEAAQSTGIQGRVIVGFVVGKDGSIRDAKVINGVEPSLDREAIRVVLSMPKWIPGKQNGQDVATNYNLPVSFKLQ